MNLANPLALPKQITTLINTRLTTLMFFMTRFNIVSMELKKKKKKKKKY
jgi:hypothetical protein